MRIKHKRGEKHVYYPERLSGGQCKNMLYNILLILLHLPSAFLTGI